MKSRDFINEAPGDMGNSSKAAALAHAEDIARHLMMQVERELEWTLTDYYDPRQVQQLVGPAISALNNLVQWLDQQQASAQESVQEMSAGGTGAGGIALGGGNGFGVRSPFGAQKSGKNPFKKLQKPKAK
jgi:hypothetical protein